jgi:hypothetical protein
MCGTAANLTEHVLPEAPLRQWVLTFPFAWRRRLAHDGALLGAVTRIFVTTVQRFYERRATGRAAPARASPTKTGAVTVLQRTSSDMSANPHLHSVFLDGAYHEEEGALVFEPDGHLRTRDVGLVLQNAVRRMLAYLRRRELLRDDGSVTDRDDDDEPALSAVDPTTPPAGPQWRRGLPPPVPSALGFDKPLCASLDGFTLHAATTAGAQDPAAREKLLRYVLRPPIAQERVEPRADGLVRIVLKRPFADGTVAVDMDPLSLLVRLASAVPPPRYHTVKYAGVLASASPWRARLRPALIDEGGSATRNEEHVAEEHVAGGDAPPRVSPYRPWAELLRRTFSLDVLECASCKGRMKLVAMITTERQITRFLTALGEPTTVPERSPSRGPPFWKSTVLRAKALAAVA